MEAAADPNSKATLLNPNLGTGAPDGVDRGKRKEVRCSTRFALASRMLMLLAC
jgi:hypothetical protein